MMDKVKAMSGKQELYLFGTEVDIDNYIRTQQAKDEQYIVTKCGNKFLLDHNSVGILFANLIICDDKIVKAFRELVLDSNYRDICVWKIEKLV